MTTLSILVSPGAEAGTLRGPVNSARIKTANQRSQDCRSCRQHGNWPGFWHLASVYGRPFCKTYSSQSDASSMFSATSSIAVARRRLWHSRCISMVREDARKAIGTDRHRMLQVTLIALLAAAVGFNRAVRAQDVPTASRVQGQAQSVGNNSTQEGNSMEAIGLLVTLDARPGKEADAEAFLKSAQPLALNENGTLKWYAIKLGPGKFGIFDTFANEGGRNAHLSGEIAKALGARANELFATPPQITKVEILASTPSKN
jgi:quinol monooxygenase YgiN